MRAECVGRHVARVLVECPRQRRLGRWHDQRIEMLLEQGECRLGLELWKTHEEPLGAPS